MQFDSFTFLIFFALVLAIYNALPSWGARKNFLLGASYVFYAAWNPPFVLLLLASSTLDWWIALRIAGATDMRARKAWVVATLLINLLVLGYFKYAGFLLDNLNALLATVGIAHHPARPDIVLPIGISFYTFHSLSYCLDVYRSKFEPTRSWRDYALYVGFFPQLVAGPIVRWTQIGEQMTTPRGTTAQGLGLGLALLTLGLFEKIVLADSVFAPVADRAFDAIDKLDAAGAWVGMLAFSGQIFCDFAGYSTCAIGAAMALGFALPINFHQPYAALGFSDFWRRWHISLSSWLRDYLYVGLGGNRHGELATYRNLFLTMLIGGLWHGAAWTFVAWGALHGVYLALERGVREHLWPRGAGTPAALRFAYGAMTLVAVMYAWVWFRVRDFSSGWSFSGKLVDFGGIGAGAATSIEQRIAVGMFAAVVVVQVLCRNHDARALLARAPKPLLAIALAAMLILIVLSPGDNHAFIYFQF
jgi:D-alanyl-lipoteichoic acid acyltransferase DltB (MBOAT superfamily)